MAVAIEDSLLVFDHEVVELHLASLQHRFPLISLHIVVESQRRFLLVEQLLLRQLYLQQFLQQQGFLLFVAKGDGLLEVFKQFLDEVVTQKFLGCLVGHLLQRFHASWLPLIQLFLYFCVKPLNFCLFLAEMPKNVFLCLPGVLTDLLPQLIDDPIQKQAILLPYHHLGQLQTIHLSYLLVLIHPARCSHYYSINKQHMTSMVVSDEVGVEEGAQGTMEFLVRLAAHKEGLPFFRVDEHLLRTNEAFDELRFGRLAFRDGQFFVVEVLDGKMGMSPSLILQVISLILQPAAITKIKIGQSKSFSPHIQRPLEDLPPLILLLAIPATVATRGPCIATLILLIKSLNQMTNLVPSSEMLIYDFFPCDFITDFVLYANKSIQCEQGQYQDELDEELEESFFTHRIQTK